MFDPPADKPALCPHHGTAVGYGRGKCGECVRLEYARQERMREICAEKMAKRAECDEDEDTDDEPAAKYRCYELEGELEQALKDRDEKERARSKLSVENMRLRLALESAAAETQKLRELLEHARERGIAEGIPLPPVPTESAAAGAGARTANDKNVQSCTECQKAKIRCDGVAPDACGPCTRKGKQCEYKDPAKRGPKRKREEMSMFDIAWGDD